MSKELAGKVALVTGGTRGIGAATALALAEHGADVAISYVASAGKAQEMADRLEALGVRSGAFAADQADPDQVRGLVSAVYVRFGRLDILVNNAGLGETGAVDAADPDQAALDRMYTVNLGGVAAAVRAAAKIMGQGGRIITVGSCVARRVGFTGMADYAATKAAVAGFTKGAARDLARRGITVNVVQPGPVATDMNPDSGDFAEALKAMTPLGRYARPEEIAAGIVFLASPAASYITGAALDIDGGLTA